MVTFEVNDMTCNHCAAAITDAVKSVDPAARLHFDLPNHRVSISPGTSNAEVLRDVIEVAGYSPALASEEETGQLAAPTQRKGCCCG